MLWLRERGVASAGCGLSSIAVHAFFEENRYIPVNRRLPEPPQLGVILFNGGESSPRLAYRFKVWSRASVQDAHKGDGAPKLQGRPLRRAYKYGIK